MRKYVLTVPRFMFSGQSQKLYCTYLIAILLSSYSLCIEEEPDEEEAGAHQFSYCLLPKEEEPKPDPLCGRFRWTNDEKIIGGEVAEIGSSPWLASIQDLQYDDPIHFCGAIIINKFFLLTAAHCVKGYPAPYDQIKVVVGEYNLAEVDGWEVDLVVKSVIIHPDYDTTNLNYDAAILQVKDKIKFNKRIAPIRLPHRPKNNRLNDLDSAKIYGWGKTEHTENPVPVLRKASIPLLSYEECQHAYTDVIKPPMMCAGNITHGGMAACTGDWGGPLVGKMSKPHPNEEIGYDDEWDGVMGDIDYGDLEYGKQFLLGIASWSIGCGLPGFPTVYVDAEQIFNWILDNTRPPVTN